MATITNQLKLISDAARLREAIQEVLRQHPAFESIVNDIALKLDLTADGLHDSAVRREQNEIARHERTLANLQERAQALIELHRAVVKDIFEPFGLIVALGEPSAGAGAFGSMSNASGGVDATVLEPQGLKDYVPSPSRQVSGGFLSQRYCFTSPECRTPRPAS